MVYAIIRYDANEASGREKTVREAITFQSAQILSLKQTEQLGLLQKISMDNTLNKIGKSAPNPRVQIGASNCLNGFNIDQRRKNRSLSFLMTHKRSSRALREEETL